MVCGIAAARNDSLGKGILSRPIVRLLGWRNNDSLRVFGITGFRMNIIVWSGLVSSNHWWQPIVAILYLDDYLAGHDGDNWKKRWEAAKNKIKWLVTKPAKPVFN